MVGFWAPDEIGYLADCLSGWEMLANYRIGAIYDVAVHMKTLKTIYNQKAKK